MRFLDEGRQAAAPGAAATVMPLEVGDTRRVRQRRKARPRDKGKAKAGKGILQF